MYYRYRGSLEIGNSAGKLGPHIDVRGEHGQVVFPGSVHPETGATYVWADGHAPWEIELADLPGHIVELLAPPDRLRQAAAPSVPPAADETPAEPLATPDDGENAPKGRKSRNLRFRTFPSKRRIACQ